MNQINTYSLSCFFLFVLINVSDSSTLIAQDVQKTNFGVSFSNELTANEILNVIPDLVELGIQTVELNHPISNDLIDNLSAYPIQILVRSNISYITRFEISESDVIRSQLSPFILEYSVKQNIVGIGIASYSDSFNEKILVTLRNQLPDSSQIRLYQVNTSLDTQLPTVINSKSIYLNGFVNQILFEAPFNDHDISIFKKTLSLNPSLVLMDWYWFSDATKSIPYFTDTILTANQSTDILLSDNFAASNKSMVDWPIIILVLLWFSVGIHIISNPTYRPLIFRYFTFHRFFVDDIMRYRERSAASGITIFVQHAFFSGLVLYILSVFFISNKGLDALFFHFPLMAIIGQNYASIFMLSFLISVIFSLFSVIWLYLPSNSMKHFSQIVNLYSWVFHLDFIIVSVMIIILITQGSKAVLLLMGGVHFLLWIIAYVVAAYDSSKYLMKGKVKYLLNTIGIFLILVSTLIVTFILSGYPFDVLRLAVRL